MLGGGVLFVLQCGWDMDLSESMRTGFGIVAGTGCQPRLSKFQFNSKSLKPVVTNDFKIFTRHESRCSTSWSS